MEHKRITLFAGHYGSGKTNAAVNYALYLGSREKHVAVADLDIVNPYFRSKDSEGVLTKNNIRLITSQFANSNVDAPALPPEAYALLDEPELYSVIDVGGDDRGALALGRYTPAILAENNYEMLLVINKYRPLTREGKDALEIMREIEQAGGIKFTAIINNSNLGEETVSDDILDSLSYADEISEKSHLPIKMTTVRHDLADSLTGKIENIFPIHIYVKQSWQRD